MNRAFWLVAAVAAFDAAYASFAGSTPVGSAFTYQGSLKQSGAPVDAAADLQFSLWDGPGGGATQIGTTQTVLGVDVNQGLFSIDLDFGFSPFNGDARWLEIAVRVPAGTGEYATLMPRQALNAAPYALRALSATTATSAASATNATQLNGQAASFYQNASNLNAGTLSNSLLSGSYSNAVTFGNAANSFAGTFNGTGAGLTGLNASNVTTGTLNPGLLPIPLALNGNSTPYILGAFGGPSGGTAGHFSTFWGTGVYGQGGTYGGHFYGDFAVGVLGEGSPYGVQGQTNGVASGAGVYGTSAHPAGVGVYGKVTAPMGGTFGGRFESLSSGGIGVYGTSAIGVKGESTNSLGIGVYGRGGGFTAVETYGVKGISDSFTGRGVYGLASTTDGVNYGGYFQTNSNSGTGVYAVATAANGSVYAMYGQANAGAAGYAVYAQGDMGASGVKSFRIDHPDDPTNKYLLHYAAESPEVINFYSGKVILDGAGEAVIEMPLYFAKINKDPRYTLTAIGAAMPNLHVAEEISDAAIETGGPCWFRIAGGAPGMKVSWEIKALRNDLWVRKRGAPVEVEKQGVEKGAYQHPELYGQPPESGMNFDPAQRERVEFRARRLLDAGD